MKTNLYEISTRYQMALEDLIDNDNIDEQTMFDTLDSIEGEFKVKGQNIIAYALSMDSQASAIKEATRRMDVRRKSLESKSERLKNYLLQGMQASAIPSIECAEFVAKIAKCPPSVEIVDAELIPEKYTEVVAEIKILKAEISKAFKANEFVPGARYIQDKKRLDIK